MSVGEDVEGGVHRDVGVGVLEIDGQAVGERGAAEEHVIELLREGCPLVDVAVEGAGVRKHAVGALQVSTIPSADVAVEVGAVGKHVVGDAQLGEVEAGQVGVEQPAALEHGARLDETGGVEFAQVGECAAVLEGSVGDRCDAPATHAAIEAQAVVQDAGHVVAAVGEVQSVERLVEGDAGLEEVGGVGDARHVEFKGLVEGGGVAQHAVALDERAGAAEEDGLVELCAAVEEAVEVAGADGLPVGEWLVELCAVGKHAAEVGGAAHVPEAHGVVEGAAAAEHVAEGGDAAGVPGGQVAVEGLAVLEHGFHGGGGGSVPGGQVAAEVGAAVEAVREVFHVGHIEVVQVDVGEVAAVLEGGRQEEQMCADGPGVEVAAVEEQAVVEHGFHVDDRVQAPVAKAAVEVDAVAEHAHEAAHAAHIPA